MTTHKIRILAAAVVLALAPMAHAQTSTTDLDKGQTQVATKIASNFTGIAGGEDNALALVRSLRTGTDVSLVTTVPPPAGSPPGTLPTTTTTTFTPPTKPMGWGNVKHSLALAQDQLARAGITNPTAAQLQTALMGGNLVRTNADGTTTTTAVKGVLTMRADGMGWGNIAKEGGTKLGAVASKVDMNAKGVKSPGTNVTTAAGSANTAKSPKGVTTAAGSATTAKPSKGITTAAGGGAVASNGKGPSKGMTTATGATSSHGSRGLATASGAGSANPPGNAHGRGIVTGAGASGTNVAAASHGKSHHAGGAGVVTGGGHGKGHGGGNGNGKGKGG